MRNFPCLEKERCDGKAVHVEILTSPECAEIVELRQLRLEILTFTLLNLARNLEQKHPTSIQVSKIEFWSLRSCYNLHTSREGNFEADTSLFTCVIVRPFRNLCRICTATASQLEAGETWPGLS